MYDTIIVKDFLTFAKFIQNNKNDHTNIGFDVETNAKLLQSKDHKVIGFSIAFTKEVGIYVPLKALDFQINPKDQRLIEKKMIQLFSENEVTVYNCLHEYPATRNWLNIEIPNLNDVYVMVKLMMGNAKHYKGRNGLKMQSVQHLGIENWSEDLEEYFSLLKHRSTKQDELRVFLKHYYKDTEIEHLIELINHIPEEELACKVISYEYIPYKVVGKYGALDSTVLIGLYEFYVDWMKRESETLGINLFIGYRVWMNHHYAGYTLETNGAYWNDEKAEEVSKWCTEGIRESNLALIKSPLTKPYIKKQFEDAVAKIIMTSYTHLLTPEYIPVSVSANTITVTCITEQAEKVLRSMSLVPKTTKKDPNTQKYVLRPGNFITILNKKVKKGQINSDYLEQIKDEAYNIIVEDYIKQKRYSNLFNPGSNTDAFKSFVNSILVTDEIKFSKLYFELLAIIDNPSFDIDYFKTFYDNSKHKIDNYPKYQKEFKMDEFKKAHSEYSYQESEDSKLLEFVSKLSKMQTTNKYRLFIKYLSGTNLSFKAYQIKNAVNTANKYKLVKLKDENIIELFAYYEFSGINIDDRTSWTPQFEWLFNYRWFKKYGKLQSTYITGEVGRKSVWLVPKDQYESGEAYTKRLYPYYSEMGNKIRNNPEELAKYDMVLQTEFNPNNAATGRWTATLHTIPSGNTIKGIIQSRYKGGVIAMPDCSQAEVRVLARVANDENLLNAFRQGLDIHRYVASLINQIPIDQVTSIQRKVAKSAVFGILYGETEQAFADEHFGGDVQKAHEIYLYFYNAFPGIKEYVEKCHEFCKKYGKVVLELTGRYIDMTLMEEGNDDKNKILRQSQNFPIQGQSSDLAGQILYKICEFITNGKFKSKPFCIIHDSIEIDFHPDETFMMLDKIKPLFNQFPDDEYGIPMASDMVFSCNMGSEIEMIDMVHDDKYNDVTITLSGFKSDIDDVIKNWVSVYDLVERDATFEESCKDVYVPLRGLFEKKVVISKEMGTTKQEITQRYHIIRKLGKS